MARVVRSLFAIEKPSAASVEPRTPSAPSVTGVRTVPRASDYTEDLGYPPEEPTRVYVADPANRAVPQGEGTFRGDPGPRDEEPDELEGEPGFGARGQGPGTGLLTPLSIVFPLGRPAESQVPRPRWVWRPAWYWSGFWVVSVLLGVALARFAPQLASPSTGTVYPVGSEQRRDPTPIHVTLTVRPSQARVFLDGEPVSGALRLQRTPDQQTHTLRVEHPGYRTVHHAIRFERDVSVTIELRRNAEPSTPTSLLAR